MLPGEVEPLSSQRTPSWVRGLKSTAVSRLSLRYSWRRLVSPDRSIDERRFVLRLREMTVSPMSRSPVIRVIRFPLSQSLRMLSSPVTSTDVRLLSLRNALSSRENRERSMDEMFVSYR